MRRLTGWLALFVILAGLGVLVYEDVRLRSDRMGEPSAVSLGAPDAAAPPRPAVPEAALPAPAAEPPAMEGAAVPAPTDMPGAAAPPARTMVATETSPVPAESRAATVSAPAEGEIAVAAVSDSSTAESASTPVPASSSAAGAPPSAVTTEAAPEASALAPGEGGVAVAPELGGTPGEGSSNPAVASSGGEAGSGVASGGAPDAPGAVGVAAVDPEDDADAPSLSAEPEPVAPGTDGETVLLAPTFSLVRVEPTGEAVAVGSAAPGAAVTLLDGANVLATADASAGGDWAIAIAVPLPPGPHDLSLRASATDGGTVESVQRVAVMVPETGDEQPLVVLNTPDAPSIILQAPAPPAESVTPADGTATRAPRAEAGTAVESLVAVEPPSAPAAAPVVAVTAVEAETSGALFVSGTATTLEDVRVYLDDLLLGEAMPSPSGTWQLEAQRELPAGAYRVRADQVEAGAGTVVARAEVPFERAVAVAVLEPVAEAGGGAGAEATVELSGPTTLVIKRRDNLWNISRQIYGDGVRWTTIYEANKDQIRDPRFIYPGQVFILPEGNVEWAAEDVRDR
jgi:nucleoid-associated protein YgaU